MDYMEYIASKWQEMAAKLREHWSQLSEKDLSDFKGDADQLMGLIHRKTGETYETIEKFLKELGSSTYSTVCGSAENISECAENAKKEAAYRMDKCCKGTKRLIRERPILSAAILIGTGILSGILLSKRRR